MTPPSAAGERPQAPASRAQAGPGLRRVAPERCSAAPTAVPHAAGVGARRRPGWCECGRDRGPRRGELSIAARVDGSSGAPLPSGAAGRTGGPAGAPAPAATREGASPSAGGSVRTSASGRRTGLAWLGCASRGRRVDLGHRAPRAGERRRWRPVRSPVIDEPSRRPQPKGRRPSPDQPRAQLTA